MDVDMKPPEMGGSPTKPTATDEPAPKIVPERRSENPASLYAALGLIVIAAVVSAVLIFTVGDKSSSSSAVITPTGCENLNIIRDIKNVDSATKQKIVAGIKKMKTVTSAYDPSMNAWDYFVKAHLIATLPSSHVHAGWKFFPWHRECIHRMNKELQRVTGDKTLMFPAWNMADPASTQALTGMDFMGVGNVTFANGYKVTEGNWKEGSWYLNCTAVPSDPGRPYGLCSLPGEWNTSSLYRAPGNGVQMCLDENSINYFLDTPVTAHEHPDTLLPSTAPTQVPP